VKETVEVSVSKRDSTGESLMAQNTWERRFKQRSEREERGGEKISTDSFLQLDSLLATVSSPFFVLERAKPDFPDSMKILVVDSIFFGSLMFV
jgi:hypothetical protein